MKILETRVYRGPNLYALWPVIRLRMDLGRAGRCSHHQAAGFSARLVEMIPSLAEHGCSYGEDGGFIRRMNEDEGTWLGHVLEHVAIELQVPRGHARSPSARRAARGCPKGQYHVVYSYVEEAVGVAAGELALRIIRHLLPPERADHDPSPFDFQAELESAGAARPAPRPGSVDRRPGAGRRGAGHPLDPPERRLARPARLRQIPEAHPGDASPARRGRSPSRSPRTSG